MTSQNIMIYLRSFTLKASSVAFEKRLSRAAMDCSSFAASAARRAAACNKYGITESTVENDATMPRSSSVEQCSSKKARKLASLVSRNSLRVGWQQLILLSL